jgi:hypothetical protein
MAGCLQDNDFAVGYAPMNKLANLFGSDDVFTALKYERRNIDFG